MIARLLTIRKEQMKIFEQLTKLEQRILCHGLHSPFDLIMIDANEQQGAHKRDKPAQEVKHQILDVSSEPYELQTQHYEQLCEQQLDTFLSEIYNCKSSYQIRHLNELMYLVENYVKHLTSDQTIGATDRNSLASAIHGSIVFS